LRLERALEEYERIKNERRRELEKIKKEYNRRLKKELKEILKELDELEKKRIPKGVDERIKRVLEGERRSYVSSLRTTLKSIESMDDLGKRLPDISKFHIGHGKYLLEVFEKEVYSINKLLKRLSEEYGSYYTEISTKELGDVDIKALREDISHVMRAIDETRDERKRLEEILYRKRRELETLRKNMGLEELEEKINNLSSEIKRLEMEIRSRASKLQKPIKRLRLGGFADEFSRDSSLAVREPEKTLKLVKERLPNFEGKQKKAAEWLIKYLPEKITEIREKRRILKSLEEKRNLILDQTSSKEKEIWEIERLIQEKEGEIRRLKRRLEHLEREFNDAIEKIETILGESIER